MFRYNIRTKDGRTKDKRQKEESPKTFYPASKNPSSFILQSFIQKASAFLSLKEKVCLAKIAEAGDKSRGDNFRWGGIYAQVINQYF